MSVFVVGVGSEGVHRLRGGEPDPAALSRRIPPDAVVTAELDAVLVDDRAGTSGEALPLEERAVVVAGEEARLLALGALGNGEAGSGSLVARRALALPAERERDAVEQRRIDRREHVGLILGRVVAARDQPQPVALDDPRVVARPEHVGTGAPGEVDERVEPEAPVAAHARVRRQALRVALDERPHDVARNSSRRSSVTCGSPSRWHVSRAAITASGEQHDALGARAGGIEPEPQGDADRVRERRGGARPRCRPRRSSPPRCVPAAGAAVNTGAIAFASASAASVSPGTAAASSSERPASGRSRPGASASTMTSSSTTSRTAA